MKRKDSDRLQATPAVALVVEWTKSEAGRALTLLDRLLAVHLAECFYTHNQEADPSVRTLAGWLGMSERSVELALPRITCEPGELQPVPFIRYRGGSPKGGARFGSRYRLHLEYLRTLYTVEGPAKPVTPVESDDRRNLVQRPAKSGAATGEASFAGRTYGKNLRKEQTDSLSPDGDGEVSDLPADDNGTDNGALTATTGRTATGGRPKGYWTDERLRPLLECWQSHYGESEPVRVAWRQALSHPILDGLSDDRLFARLHCFFEDTIDARHATPSKFLSSVGQYGDMADALYHAAGWFERAHRDEPVVSAIPTMVASATSSTWAVEAVERQRIAAANDAGAFARRLPNIVRALSGQSSLAVEQWVRMNRSNLPPDGEQRVLDALEQYRQEATA